MSALMCSTQMVNDVTSNMYSDHYHWQKNILGHNYNVSHDLPSTETASLAQLFRSWLGTHEEAQAKEKDGVVSYQEVKELDMEREQIEGDAWKRVGRDRFVVAGASGAVFGYPSCLPVAGRIARCGLCAPTPWPTAGAKLPSVGQPSPQHSYQACGEHQVVNWNREYIFFYFVCLLFISY
ncbi:uncharacterized protein LOC128679501 isoform X2 [Plodia interpunctella]